MREVDNCCVNCQGPICSATIQGEYSLLCAIIPVKSENEMFYRNCENLHIVRHRKRRMITNTTESRNEKIGVDEEKTQLQLRTMHGQNCVGSAIMNDLVTPNMEENNPVKTITISLQIEGEGVDLHVSLQNFKSEVVSESFFASIIQQLKASKAT